MIVGIFNVFLNSTGDYRGWFYIIPILFLLFSICVIFLKEINSKKMTHIKRIYYSLCVFGIVFAINKIDLSQITVSNTFGFPQEIWTIFFVFIVGIAISIVLGILIISAADIKEVTLGWAKISREEIKNNIEEQKLNNDRLLNKIEAEYEVIQNFDNYVTNSNIENKLITNYSNFDWENEFRLFIQYYCNFQSTNIEVNIVNSNATDFEDNLKNTFKITSANIKTIKTNIAQIKSTTIMQKDTFLFIPYKSNYYTNPMLFVLKGKTDCVFEIEQRFVLNIIKLFESYVTDILANILPASLTP